MNETNEMTSENVSTQESRTKRVSKIIPAVPKTITKKKVAGYVRVSKETERLHHSLSAQISYFSQLIQSNPEWEYAGVYADEAVTGTLTTKRSDFQRMLADCEAGKIDIILTKSISRFARNTVDLLTTVRRLKALGIEVRFEKEGISSLSGDGEVMLTLLASFAQDEVYSLSGNSKWGIHKRFEAGTIGTANKRLLGYRFDDEQKKYVIVPEETDSVRWMFRMYLDGLPFRDIAEKMNEAGIRSVLGNKFSEGSVHQLIFNEVYVGDIRRQKTYTPDPITKLKVINRGELPQFYMSDCHDAIIDRETYAKVQEEMKRRAAMLNPTYCFSGKMHCGICGMPYSRNKAAVKGHIYIRWMCRSKKESGLSCTNVNFREDELEKICADVLDMDAFDETAFNDKVKDIIVQPNGDLEFRLTGGETRLWKNLHLNPTRHVHSVTDAFQGKIRCAKCGCTYHRVNAANKWVYWYCIGKKRKGVGCNNINYTDHQLRQISAHILGLDAFDEQTFTSLIDFITVQSDGSLKYQFYDGRTEIWQKT